MTALSSCSQVSDNSGSNEFRTGDFGCSGSAIPDSFIIRWKNGHVTKAKAANRQSFIEQVLNKNKGLIDFAEHDYYVKAPVVTKADVEAQAFVDNYWGQTKIEADAAWQEGDIGSGVLVAVVDSGVEITHAQIRNQVWTNPNETFNGIDDDSNGLVDDVYGYDFADNTGNVGDTSGHGTHVAGIILAEHGVGPAKGIAPGARLMTLDFMNGEGGTISDSIRAIQYAASHGAKIINASWGGEFCSEALREAISDLTAQGVLFVAAAGNSGRNLDWVKEFPAAFQSGAQITVGSSTSLDAVSDFSNYSWDLVQLFAPGSLIMSTYKGGTTTTLSGTSMAAPFVSGAAAVLWGYRPTASLAQIRTAIFNSVDLDPSEPNGSLPSITGGRLNLRKALEELTTVLP